MTHPTPTPPSALRRGLSLKLKVAVAAFTLTAVVVAGVAWLLVRAQLGALRQELLERAITEGKLAAKELEPAVAFDDAVTAREVFEALRSDPDFRGASLFHDRALVATTGSMEDVDPAGARADALVLHAGPRGVRVTVPVRAREGERGTLVVTRSLDRLAAARSKAIAATSVIAAASMAFTLVAAWLLSRSLTRRLDALSATAEAVAGGRLDVAVPATSSADEVGHLGRAFEVMLKNIHELIDARDAAAKDEQRRLAELVAARTADLQRVLDHVADGLATIDAHGRLRAEHSRAFAAWFGAPVAGASFAEHLRATNPDFADRFEVGFELLRDDVLPLEMSLAQLPHRLRVGRSVYDVRLTPLDGSAALEGAGVAAGFLVVIEDRTSALEQEEAQAVQRDLAAALDLVVRDRSGFAEFVADATPLVERLEGARDASPEVLRDLHTMKGTCALTGFDALAALCHRMESHVVETGDLPPAAEVRALAGRWRRIRSTLSELVGTGTARVDVERRDLEALTAAIAASRPHAELLSRARSLALEPSERRLERFAFQARALATKLGRGDVAIDIEPNGVKLDPSEWGGFWSSFTHVVRNAITHGIETPEERARAKKAPGGRIVLATKLVGNELLIEARDDGRGIDWEAVGAAATKRGVPSRSQSDLEEALFADGVTTRDAADDVAGRGVGLSSVRAETVKLGGRIEIETRAARGTTFRFKFKKGSAAEVQP